MPRYQQKREFQIGEYWLSQKPSGSVAWCRTWHDPDTQQTKRLSLRTSDFEDAKQKLTDWYILNEQKQQSAPEDVAIASILARYWEEHGQNLRSKWHTKVAIRYWVEFYDNRPVSDLRDIRLQEQFHAWLLAKDMKASSVSRVITTGRSAINRAWKRGELAHVPFVADIAKTHRHAPQPRGRPMEKQEILRFFEAATTDTLKSYILWLLATGARREAIMDLTLERCDLHDRLIILNPRGRVQTTKHRPTIRMPEAIVPFVIRLQEVYGPHTHVIGLKPEAMGSLHRSWNYTRDKAGFGKDINSYSIRHTISRELSRRQVSIYEINAHLGHKRQNLSITEIYAPYNPTFLTGAAKAIDAYFAELCVESMEFRGFLKGFRE